MAEEQVPAEAVSAEEPPEEQAYIPLSERLNQDVWHDNFVPKYSAIPAARPTRVVLIGVWLIFAPAAVLSLTIWLSDVQLSKDPMARIFSTAGFLFMFSVSLAILYQQTRRYWRAKWHREPAADAAEEA